MGFLRTLTNILGAATGLFAIAVAITNMVGLGKLKQVAFSTNFPSCGGAAGCISPLFNSIFEVGVLSGITLVLGLVLFVHCVREPLKTQATVALEAKEAGFFIILGFMLLGQAAVIGFSAGIISFAVALLFIFVYLAKDGGYSRI